MKDWATKAGVKGCGRAQKRAYLESFSTTTMMTDLLPDFGRPVMKSIETSVQIEAGMGNGCNVPGDLTVSPLWCWQMSHLATKVRFPFSCLSKKMIFESEHMSSESLNVLQWEMSATPPKCGFSGWMLVILWLYPYSEEYHPTTSSLLWTLDPPVID